MFVAALFIMAETWTQTMSINRGINEDMCVYTRTRTHTHTHTHTHTKSMEYYSAIKKNEIMPLAATRMGYHMK